MADFVDTTLKDIDERLSELKEEMGRLEAARTALTSGRSSSAAAPGTAAPARTRASRTRASRSTGAGTGARRRPGRPRGRRGGNTRASQALELVRSQPGISIPELATAMKIQPNYLYRVMPGLEQDGSVKRTGARWFPSDS